jgi:hypothetical protein
MTTYKSQCDRIKMKLDRDGFVTRNECLSQFPAITRLGARIDDLERRGYVFKTEDTGRDYIYRLISKPAQPQPTRA